MKQRTQWMLVALFALVCHIPSAWAQNQPAGIRMEVAEAETDKGDFSIFTYKDEDGTFGYYLSLGRVTKLLGAIRDDITDMSFDDIRETTICLGATYDEALSTLNSIIDLFDKDVDTTAEFQGRATTGADRLGEPSTTNCIVDKKPVVGGKRLLFVFTSGNRQSKTYVSKTVLKELRTGLKIDKKLHPKQHR